VPSSLRESLATRFCLTPPRRRVWILAWTTRIPARQLQQPLPQRLTRSPKPVRCPRRSCLFDRVRVVARVLFSIAPWCRGQRRPPPRAAGSLKATNASFLAMTRALAAEDTASPCNWQEIARWLVRSRLDPQGRIDLQTRENEDEGLVGVDEVPQYALAFSPTMRACDRLLAQLMRRKDAIAAFNEPREREDGTPVFAGNGSSWGGPIDLNTVRQRMQDGVYTRS
jgi:hypothetical protein